jgi:hypothetical protein
MENRSRRFFLVSAGAASVAPLCMKRRLSAEEKDQRTEQLLEECRAKAERDEVSNRIRYARPLIEKFGPEVLKEIERVTIAGARDWMRGNEIEKRDLGAVCDWLWKGLPKRFEYQQVEDSPQRLSFRVTRCPLASDALKQNAGDIGFAYYCAWDFGFCQGLNPKIKFTRTKTLMRGDDHCDHTYELSEI